MAGLRDFAARYQAVIFVLLTLLLSWAVVIPAQGSLIPHGPMIAAFLVLAIASGRKGVSQLWTAMTRWRIDLKWYLVAPGIFLGFHLCALLISLLRGAEIANTAHLQSLPAYLGVIGTLVLLGGWWEEPGWMGYLLRHLQARWPRSLLVATLAVGLVRVVWHTPLLLYGLIPWHDYVFYSLALQIVLTWLYNQTKGSVLIVMVGHLFSNVLFATMSPLFSSANQGRYWSSLSLAAAAIALGIVIATRGKLGMRADREPTPSTTPV